VVRLFNPSDATLKTAVRLNEGWSQAKVQSPVERVQAEFKLPGKGKAFAKVRTTDLEELAKKDLSMDKDGWVNIEVTKKKIMTIEFLP
jgi:hypothetical protein